MSDSRVVIEEFRRIVLKLFLKIVEKKSSVVVPGLLWRNLWVLRRSLEIFVVTLWKISDNFEVIVIVNKTSFMVELDDCYCCAN